MSIKSESEQRTLVTDTFRKNHERLFGEAKPKRGRWVWDARRGEMVPAEEYVPEEVDTGRVPVVSDLYMDGVAATDGTDIGSRRKRAEYMKRNGLADAADFNAKWKDAEKKREAFRSGALDPRTRETVARALYEQSKRKPRK